MNKRSVKLNKEWVKMCSDFSEKVLPTNANIYSLRGKVHVNKIKQDIFNGKMGEIAVYIYLSNSGLKCSFPDFKIYSAGKKSFDADLKVGRTSIHVKTQTKESANKYGNSWLFQKSDPVVDNPTDYDMFYGVLLDGENAEILLSKPAKQLLYKDCKLGHMNNNKVAVYALDNLIGVRS